MHKHHNTSGFTLIEMLVALILVGILGVVATGFLTPLKINQTSGLESQATNYARSYLELVKGRWLNPGTFSAKTLPVACAPASTNTNCDLKLTGDWTVSVPTTQTTAWTATDTIRTITVQAKLGTYSYEFSTFIAQP